MSTHELSLVVISGRNRLCSNRGANLPALSRRLNPEPDGVRGRQEQQGDHGPAKRPTNQGVRERSPEHRVRERNEREHGSQRRENDGPRTLHSGFDYGIEWRQSILLVLTYLTHQDERVAHEDSG